MSATLTQQTPRPLQLCGATDVDDERLYQVLGARLRTVRTRRASENRMLTQAALGSLVGMKRTSITNFENGTQRVPLHTLMRICQALGTTVAEVVPEFSDVAAAAVVPTITGVDALRNTVDRSLPLVGKAVASVLKSSGL